MPTLLFLVSLLGEFYVASYNLRPASPCRSAGQGTSGIGSKATKPLEESLEQKVVMGWPYHYKGHAAKQFQSQADLAFSLPCVSLSSPVLRKDLIFLPSHFLFLCRITQPSCPLFSMCVTLTLYPFQLASCLGQPHSFHLGLRRRGRSPCEFW